MNKRITPSQFLEAAGGHDWRVVGDGACAFFRTESFAAGTRLVAAIGALAGVDDHPPDIHLRSDGVTGRLVTVADDYYGMTGSTSTWPSGSRASRAGTARRPTRRPSRASS
jgi:4a-hydroxytetrahydrobiopterin dehydratase